MRAPLLLGGGSFYSREGGGPTEEGRLRRADLDPAGTTAGTTADVVASTRAAFTLVEIVFVLAVVGVLAAFATGPLARMRTSAALQSGRAQVTAALSLAQATAIRWGRTTTVSIDTVRDVLSVSVDTARYISAPVVLRSYDLGATLGVQLRTDRTALCYSARGVGTATVDCPTTGAQVIVVAEGRADTISINSAGRVWR